MLPISAFIICQNEERVIEACVRSVSFCAEIVVVDSGSTDATLAILERLRAEGCPCASCTNPGAALVRKSSSRWTSARRTGVSASTATNGSARRWRGSSRLLADPG